jgi:PIN domain nuclease of toxin-antitoxin system
MRYLLDTHTFIWMDSDPSRLSPRVFDLCQDSNNTLVLSVTSAWEMMIKTQAGKLALPASPAYLIKSQCRTNGIRVLPIRLSHVLGLSDLPRHHKDPFDRLLVAQAIAGHLVVLSHDPQIARYPLQVVW